MDSRSCPPCQHTVEPMLPLRMENVACVRTCRYVYIYIYTAICVYELAFKQLPVPTAICTATSASSPCIHTRRPAPTSLQPPELRAQEEGQAKIAVHTSAVQPAKEPSEPKVAWHLKDIVREGCREYLKVRGQLWIGLAYRALYRVL